MIKKHDLVARAHRFVTGEFRVEDITTLLLFLRSNSFGKATIHDLGHMVGHADIRDQGLSVDRVSALGLIASFKLGTDNSGQWALNDAPPELISVMKSTLTLLSDKLILHHTGLGKIQALTGLKRISKRFVVKESGRLEWTGYPPSNKELRLMNCLTRFIISRPLYSPDELFADFEFVLLKHGFIANGQIESPKEKRDLLAAYAVAAMNNVTFSLPDGSTVEAHSGCSTDDRVTQLSVHAILRIPFGEQDGQIAFPLFESGLDPKDWWEPFEPDLLRLSFTRPIELTNQRKLRFI